MTSALKKMKLISEAELDRLRAKQIREYDPELSSMARIQGEIDNILSDDSTSASEKIDLLRTFQHRFKSLSDKEAMGVVGVGVEPRPQPVVAVPVPVAAAPAAAPAAAAAVQIPEIEDAPAVLKEAIQLLPAQYHAKGTRMIKVLSKRPNIFKVDEDTQQIVVHGKPIEGSNVHDLIRHAYLPRKGQVPAGLGEFTKAIRSLNIPFSYFSNSKFITSVLKGAKAGPVAEAEPGPPGAHPKVLAVYDEV